uniref:RING-type domain-containing protein n=1 Tax=Caenorhabditis tropicalis TaxID=1561998 RepID=A0A1I7TR17_9PELO
MAARVILADIDLEEQRQLHAIIEQENKDRELAQRLFRQEMDPPRRRGQGTRRGGSAAPARRSGGGSPVTPMRRSRGGGATGRGRGARGGARRAVIGQRPATIAQRPTPRATIAQRPATIAQRPRPRATIAQRPAPSGRLQFNGDRLQVRNGNQVIDVTDDAFFPDSDEDSDYDGDDDNATIELSDSSSEVDSDHEEEEEEARIVERERNISASFIRSLLNPRLIRDNMRTDPNYAPRNNVEEPPSSSSSSSNSDAEDSDDSSIEDDDDMMLGGLRADRNHIAQPLLGDDQNMYDRELDLYYDDDDYVVPPPAEVPKKGGKEIPRDSTWGDCTMCSQAPIKPQGCRKCLQFLGCADCVKRWHAARVSAYERPTCPLCRAPWNQHTPGVLLMPTIEKHRQKTGYSGGDGGGAGGSAGGSGGSGPSTSTAS